MLPEIALNVRFLGTMGSPVVKQPATVSWAAIAVVAVNVEEGNT
jgi:hypothetical protein